MVSLALAHSIASAASIDKRKGLSMKGTLDPLTKYYTSGNTYVTKCTLMKAQCKSGYVESATHKK